MTAIYRGTSMQDRIAAIIAEGQAGEAADRVAREAQYRDCPRRTGPLRTLCHEAQGECRGRCIEMRALGLYDSGQPAPRKHRPSCGAKTRAGGECQVRVEAGKRRCRFHGGKSTGPKTDEGRARIAEAQRRRWQAYRDGRAKVKADAKAQRKAARIAAML